MKWEFNGTFSRPACNSVCCIWFFWQASKWCMLGQHLDIRVHVKSIVLLFKKLSAQISKSFSINNHRFWLFQSLTGSPCLRTNVFWMGYLSFSKFENRVSVFLRTTLMVLKNHPDTWWGLVQFLMPTEHNYEPCSQACCLEWRIKRLLEYTFKSKRCTKHVCRSCM